MSAEGFIDFASVASGVLDDLRERTGVTSWWVCRRRGDQQDFLAAADEVFGIGAGESRPWEDSFCRRMLSGEAPQAAPVVDDVPAYAQARTANGLAATSLVAVPMTSYAGDLVGTLFGASRTPVPDVAELLPTVRLQAALLGELLAAEQSQAQGRPAPPAPLELATGAERTERRVVTVDSLLRLVTRQLGTEVAFVNRFEGDQRRFRNLVSSVEVPVAAGYTGPREGSYCQLIVDGELGAVTADTRAEPLVADLPVTGELGIGSYLGVPLRTTDGELYGTLCTYSRQPDPSLRERDVDVLAAVADVVMGVVEREEREEQERRGTLDRLDRLFAEGGPVSVYQPIVDLDGLEQVGVEALSRFPTGTPNPAEWFAEASAAGLGASLELRAIASAVTALPRLDGFLALNVSPATACEPGFDRGLAGLPLDRLVLEITEHEAIEDYDALSAALAPLRARGVRIAVDDTGAGFASMRHVLALVPDLVKLDISLVRGIDTDRARQALAAALTTFAATTGAQVIAEGVETASELACLRRLGVTYGQGYYLGRPAPLPLLEHPDVPRRQPQAVT